MVYKILLGGTGKSQTEESGVRTICSVLSDEGDISRHQISAVISDIKTIFLPPKIYPQDHEFYKPMTQALELFADVCAGNNIDYVLFNERYEKAAELIEEIAGYHVDREIFAYILCVSEAFDKYVSCQHGEEDGRKVSETHAEKTDQAKQKRDKAIEKLEDVVAVTSREFLNQLSITENNQNEHDKEVQGYKKRIQGLEKDYKAEKAKREQAEERYSDEQKNRQQAEQNSERYQGEAQQNKDRCSSLETERDRARAEVERLKTRMDEFYARLQQVDKKKKEGKRRW